MTPFGPALKPSPFQFGTRSSSKGAFKFQPSKIIHPDTFSTLFPDVAILVFEELARVDHPNTHSLGWMRAAQVNNLWRATILNMPMLWARNFLSRGYKAGFKHFLARTQTCPLTLDLQLPREALDMQRIKGLLSRTKTLLRSGSRDAIFHILLVLSFSPLPLLEEVTLTCCEEETISFISKDYLSTHLSLRTVTLYGCIISVPGHITSLSVSLRGREYVTSADKLAELLVTLSHIPRLESLTVQFQEYARFGSAPFGGLPEHIADLPALTELVLDDPSSFTGEVVTEFLNHISAPSLTRVRVTEAFKYTESNGEALRRHDIVREFQALIAYFGLSPCVRNATFLAIESCMVHPVGHKGSRPDEHLLVVRLGPDSPQVSTSAPLQQSRGLTLCLHLTYNPQQTFPAAISHALEAANVPLQQIQVLDVDLSWFDGLSAAAETVFQRCVNVERIIIGRRNVHETTHAVLQALSPSVPENAELTNPKVLLPRLHTIEFPSAHINRIYFIEFLAARHACGAQVHRLIIPSDADPRIMVLPRKSMSLGRIRNNVLERLRIFAIDVGAKVVVKETSPLGKPGTCPTEILFIFNPALPCAPDQPQVLLRI